MTKRINGITVTQYRSTPLDQLKGIGRSIRIKKKIARDTEREYQERIAKEPPGAERKRKLKVLKEFEDNFKPKEQ